MRAVSNEAGQATPEQEELRLLREIEDRVLHISPYGMHHVCIGSAKARVLCTCMCVHGRRMVK